MAVALPQVRHKREIPKEGKRKGNAHVSPGDMEGIGSVYVQGRPQGQKKEHDGDPQPWRGRLPRRPEPGEPSKEKNGVAHKGGLQGRITEEPVTQRLDRGALARSGQRWVRRMPSGRGWPIASDSGVSQRTSWPSNDRMGATTVMRQRRRRPGGGADGPYVPWVGRMASTKEVVETEYATQDNQKRRVVPRGEQDQPEEAGGQEGVGPSSARRVRSKNSVYQGIKAEPATIRSWPWRRASIKGE